MNAAFTLAVYGSLGVLAAIWLRAAGRMPNAAPQLVMAAVFWPIYLPVVLASPPPSLRSKLADPAVAALAERIERLSVDESRRTEYRALVERIAATLLEREAQLERLRAGRQRLEEMGRTLAQPAMVQKEIVAIDRSRKQIEGDLLRAKESVVRLALRLEVFELRAPADGTLDGELGAFQQELDRVLEAHEEIERLGTAVEPRAV